MTAFKWASSKTGTIPHEEVYCQTRDVAQGRISTLQIMLERGGWNENHAALIAAILGELTGNCFDHNLGQWRDVPGCWFEYQMVGDIFTAEVADRGQGILSSLQKVRPKLSNHRESLHLAFTEQVSGRAPENRGNGLKFVVRSLTKLPEPHFLFHSGDAKIELVSPIDTGQLDKYIAMSNVIVPGTHAEVTIRKIQKI